MGVRDVDATTAKNRAALRGTGLLFTSALVWGCAFVPQAISVENMSAWWASGLRFALAAPIALVLAGRRLRAPGVTVASAVVLGVIFAIAFWLQTEAVRTAPVARVALITGTYAVFTPLFAPLFGLRRPTVLHWGGAGVAFLGLGLLVGLVGGGDAVTAPLGRGDVYTLLHAMLSAVHLLLVGRLAARADALALNAMQLTVMGVTLMGVALLFSPAPDLAVFDGRTVMSFLYLAAFSSVLAFACQIAGQRTASAPAAAVVLLLEAPIGAAVASWVRDEALTGTQFAGAVVLLVGVGLSVVADVARPAHDAGGPAAVS